MTLKPATQEFIISDRPTQCALKFDSKTRSTIKDSDTVPFGLFAYLEIVLC